MSPELLFLIGTVATWVGWGLVIRSLFQAIRRMLTPKDHEMPSWRGIALSLGIGAVLLLIGQATPLDPGRVVEGPVRIPVSWVLMSFQGWVVAVSLFFVFSRLIQAKTALNAAERKARVVAATWWSLTAIAFGAWFLKSDGEFKIFRGAISTSATTLIALLALAVVATIAMTLAGRAIKVRGLSKTILIHATLLLGCVIFGFPFAWLLITSFKEEKDMTSSSGIIWVPRVQETHPYLDTDKPLVRTQFEGKSVLAAIDDQLGEGRVLLEIERPYGLRGRRFEARATETEPVPRDAPIVSATIDGVVVKGFVARELDNGARLVEVLTPPSKKGERFEAPSEKLEPVRRTGLRWQNYSEALEWMPFETNYGLRYLQNTLVLVIMSVIGTVLSCAVVGYGFSRLRFPGRNLLFNLMLATMMLPGAVTMLPTFLIFRNLGWIDSLAPLWVPTFFAGAFNVFLLKQFFSTIPMELEEAARIDGASYVRTFWQVMLPQVKPALAAISIWTFMGAWNNFMGPLIYISSPEKMPVAYALQLFAGDRAGQYGMLMAFSAMAIIPVLLLFFAAQRYFIEGVQLSGLGGR